ncbi:hypothetical protein JOB18_004207 [Solea senegalensis]|uniref:Uncharacterized protein n=1 Tax=Solea senegalensis TaxID=28829 RepID=A0AAV6QQD7_SOLSE|nr:hypothetical protein JOB18_004207 [Solea senegalensis]
MEDATFRRIRSGANERLTKPVLESVTAGDDVAKLSASACSNHYRHRNKKVTD